MTILTTYTCEHQEAQMTPCQQCRVYYKPEDVVSLGPFTYRGTPTPNPPSASLGSDGVTATLYEDHLTLHHEGEDVTLTMREAVDLFVYLRSQLGSNLS